MAKYQIDTPDGTYEIEAPDGTPDFEAYRILTTHLAAQQSRERLVPPTSATEGMSGAQLFGAGMGKNMVDLGRGVGQYAGMVSRQDVADARQTDAPLMETGAGNLGNVAGAVATTLPAMFVPGLNTVKGAAAFGTLYGAAQPSTSTAETVANTAIGGAAGAAGQKAGQFIADTTRAPSTSLTSAQKQAANNKLGLRLTPGQAAGSKTMERVEAALSSNPVTSGRFDALREKNQRRLNEIAAKAIGEQSDELSAPVLQNAFNRIGNFYDTLNTPTPVQLDQAAITQRLSDVLDNYTGQYAGAGDVSANALWQNFDKLLGKGTATQAQLSRLSSNLNRAVKNNMTNANGDRTMGLALADLKEVVDDALMGALPQAQQQLFNESRAQYRTLMQLTGRLGVVNPSSGNVSGRTLANTLQQGDRRGFTQGRNQTDLYNAARFYQAFPGVVGDSGTATRTHGADLTNMLMSVPANLLMRLYLSSPSVAAAGAGAPVVAAGRNAVANTAQYGIPAASIMGAPAAANALLPLIYGQQ